MANSWTKTYSDGNDLLESELDSGYGSVQPEISNLALATTGSSNQDLLVSSGSNVPPSFKTPDQVAATIGATGANAIAATMTSTGANAIFADLSSCTAATADLIGASLDGSACQLIFSKISSAVLSTASSPVNIASAALYVANKVIRTTQLGSASTSVNIGDRILSASSGSYTNSQTNFVNATNLTGWIACSGGDIEIELVAAAGSAVALIGVQAASASASVSLFGQCLLTRNGTTVVGVIEFGQLLSVSTGTITNLAVDGSISDMKFRDVALAAGTYQYQLQSKVAGSSPGTVSISNCRLLMKEDFS